MKRDQKIGALTSRLGVSGGLADLVAVPEIAQDACRRLDQFAFLWREKPGLLEGLAAQDLVEVGLCGRLAGMSFIRPTGDRIAGGVPPTQIVALAQELHGGDADRGAVADTLRDDLERTHDAGIEAGGLDDIAGQNLIFGIALEGLATKGEGLVRPLEDEQAKDPVGHGLGFVGRILIGVQKTSRAFGVFAQGD